LAACQTEPEFDVNMGDGTTTISVVLPEDAVTRAGENDSALGGLDNTTGETVRVIFEVYYKGETNADLRQVKYLTEGELQANFDVRLVPGRDYTFVAWADMVDGVNAGDKYYNTSDLKAVTMMPGTWDAMVEQRDAYTATKLVENFQSTSNIELKLVRPFAKLRVVTTDMAQLNDLRIVPTTATVSYSSLHYTTFNAFAGVAEKKENSGVAHTQYTVDVYNENWEGDANLTLYADYFFAAEDVVNFSMIVYDQNGVEIGAAKSFTTDIPVKRNNLTTIIGTVLTEANNIKVEVTPAFEAEYIYIEGDYTLTENMFIDRPMVVRPGTSAVLDLNGHTITADLKQEGRHHYAIDNYGTLTLEGEGAINARGIENFGTMTINGNITITNVDTDGGSAIWNEGNLVINGGTFTTNAMAGVGSYGTALNTQVGGSAVINGGNFIANSQLSYAILNYGETVINNATVKGKHGAVGSAKGAAYKTTINGGSFELMENPNVSDHCVYCVSEIKGGKFTLGTNTDSGAQVFYDSTIATGYKAIEVNGKYVVVADEVDSVVADTSVMNAIKGKNATVYVMPKEDGSNILLEGKLSMAEGVKLIGMGDTPVALFNDWGSNAFANQAHFTDTYVENINFTNNLVIDAGIANGDVKFVNCVFGGDRAHQGVHFDSGTGIITFDNCTFVGRNMLGSSIEKVVFNNCTFLNKKSSLTGADKWTGVNMWGKYEFNNCIFDTEAHCNVKCDGVIAAFNNCKYVDNRDITTIINNSQNYTAEITF
jgi:hypothetical protein